jgi:small ligand-binding sensory domain FIST
VEGARTHPTARSAESAQRHRVARLVEREDVAVKTRVGVGISAENGGVDSFAEAAGRAAVALDALPDLACVFAAPANLERAAEGLAAVYERLRPRALVGCGAQGVAGERREVETGGVAVWAASVPGAEVVPFRLEAGVARRHEPEAGGEAAARGGLVVDGLPDLEGADAVIMLADPYSFPLEPVLTELSQRNPGVPVIGGIASGGPGPAALLEGREPVAGGAVGAVLRGVDVRPLVSQGARPIGPEMAITGAEGNVIHELASRPALERLRHAISELEPSERALAAEGLLVGIVVDPNKPDYDRGDFLIRGLVGADEESGAVTVGATVRLGQTVRLQVRDAASAHDDLVQALGRQVAALGRPPAGALLFTCNGRGSRMFGSPGHDAEAVADAFVGAPTAGFFCAGEIGPVGGRNYVHGFTATLAVFPG